MAKISTYIGYGLHAARPAAGAPGALFFASDTGLGYRDNGSTWDQITGAPIPFTYTPFTASGDFAVPSGNALVVLSGTHTVTLPDPAAAAGQSVIVKSATGDSFTVHNSDATAADGTGQVPWHGVSDGTQFWNVDF